MCLEVGGITECSYEWINLRKINTRSWFLGLHEVLYHSHSLILFKLEQEVVFINFRFKNIKKPLPCQHFVYLASCECRIAPGLPHYSLILCVINKWFHKIWHMQPTASQSIPPLVQKLFTITFSKDIEN